MSGLATTTTVISFRCKEDTDKLHWESQGEAEPSLAPAIRYLDDDGSSKLVRHVVIGRKLSNYISLP